MYPRLGILTALRLEYPCSQRITRVPAAQSYGLGGCV